jgi:hypothetical protein
MYNLQDFDHEAQKDFIYLLEEKELLKQELFEEMNRKPANIIIIKEHKIKDYEEHNVSKVSPIT